MAWRLHLTNQAIRRLEILPGKPRALIAAWTEPLRAFFLDLETGAPMGEKTFAPPDTATFNDERWQQFLTTLTAPGGSHLARIDTPGAQVFLSEDGATRLYYQPPQLTLDIQGKPYTLSTDEPLVAVGYDRVLSLTAALAADGCVHIFQQQTSTGRYPTSLDLSTDLRSSITVPNGGSTIFASDGRTIVGLDSGGTLRHTLTAHYPIQRIRCSPNGRHLVTSDIETNVIRVYDGSTLQPTYQRHAVDLLAAAQPVQLIADLPPSMVALNALVVGGKGRLVFAMHGVICAAEIGELNALPRR